MKSVRGRLLCVFLRLASPKGSIQRKPIERLRQELERDMSRYKVSRRVQIERIDCGGTVGEWVVPEIRYPKRVLFYIHGGGYFGGSCNSHRPFVARLADLLGAKALRINYRLAPENPFPAAVEDCLSTYKWLLDEGKDNALILGGESAGATLALATMLGAKAEDLPLPTVAFCFSPQTDFTLNSLSIRKRADQELMFTLEDLRRVYEIYARDQDPKNPLISPIFGDFRGFPPLQIHASDSELLLDDSTRLFAKSKEAGVTVELRTWPGLFHAFPLVLFLPESKKALRDVSVFVDDVLGRSPSERLKN